MCRVMCMASEIGKIVVNKCLERNIFINTQKLEKLLVLMQIEYMKRYKKILFHENILVWKKCGVVIKEVDTDFIMYAIEFKEKQEEFIALLDGQIECVEFVLECYGNLDAFEINRLPVIQDLISKSIIIEEQKVIPANIMLGFYL